MNKIKQFILPILLGLLLAVVLLGCPTEAPKDKDKDKGGGDDEVIDVSAIIQSSLWENDAEKDCGVDANANSGNGNKYVYIFDTDGKYYTTSFTVFQALLTRACSNTSGWPLTVSRSATITAATNFLTRTYSVSGNTITLSRFSSLNPLKTFTMTFSTSGGGTLTHENGTVYTKLDVGSD